MRNARRNSSEILIKEEEYIEKKVNALSIYNVYWCLYELRRRGKLLEGRVLKNDSFCKLQLIRILKQRRYSVRSLNIFLEVSAENSIPLSYVKWFHDDTRAALWLKMVLRNTINSSESIVTESDISIFIHDVIFNNNLLVLSRKIVETNSDSQIAMKKIALELLKDAYLLSRVNSTDVKWLTNNGGSVKINHIYQYMNKLHDLNNLRRNKENKKKNGGRKTHINKDGYQQALICPDTIKFKETDTAMRLCHILASLDYWMFDTYWLYEDGDVVDRETADNRGLFISNMEDVWNSKQRRDRNKIKKNQGIDLTSDNKKNLKYLAKACGKTQREVLNDLVESAYSQMRGQDIQLDPSFPNQYASFDKIPLEQPCNSQSEDNEEKSTLKETSRTDNKEEPSRSYNTESSITSVCDNEKLPTVTPTPKQEASSLQTFLPEENYGKQIEDAGNVNTDSYHKL